MPASRRSVMFSLPPLWLIGVCLFLPTVRACEKLESPASLLWGSPPFFTGLLAPYLVAQLLAIVVVVALARGRIAPLLTRAAAVLVVVSGASSALLAIVGLERRNHLDEQLWSVFAGLCFVAAGVVMVRARRLEPWTRLAHFLAAYTIFTLPMATLLARILVGDGLHKIGYGAFVFFAAYAALVGVHVRTLGAARDPVSPSTA
jgi:hypothetical protein